MLFAEYMLVAEYSRNLTRYAIRVKRMLYVYTTSFSELLQMMNFQKCCQIIIKHNRTLSAIILYQSRIYCNCLKCFMLLLRNNYNIIFFLSVLL